MKTVLLDYQLPPELIASHPTRVRRHCRLLVLDRHTGSVAHHRFDELPILLKRGDLLVVNNTAVIPARLLGHREPGGGQAEIFLLEDLGERRWRTMVRPGARLKPGARVGFGTGAAGRFRAEVESAAENGTRTVRFIGEGSFAGWLARVGQVPLPPYIDRPAQTRDRRDYQTIFARRPGAVASPTAGLHFDPVLTGQLKRKGIVFAPVTLHVGAGTFRPIRVDNIEDHALESERYSVRADAWKRIVKKHGAAGGRIVAVGTTSVRVIETLAGDAATDVGIDRACGRLSGRTELFIKPGHRFQLVDVLITNFHLPRSSLLALVVAFADQGERDGLAMVMDAYRQAIRERYRFYSFGDAMLIL